MRTALCTLAMTVSIFALASPSYASPYCDGYNDGYRKGYCEGKKKCHLSDKRRCAAEGKFPDTYAAGYQSGYEDGQRRARGSDSDGIPAGQRQRCEWVQILPGENVLMCRDY
jgi:flagellar biosynthesis/type III secretory pathway protein FliH